MTTPIRCPRCQAELPADAPAGLCPACLLQAGMDAEVSGTAARFQPPPLSELAEHFPQLELLEPIGHGGMGAVYKARQKHLDRLVALKVLAPELAKDAAFAERFAREARALARLNHPHLVTVYDFGQSGPWFWILMELVEGANLRQVLATGKLSSTQALAIVPQLCEALQYAHDEGVVHRDIKPENILLDRHGQAKVADFGLAKLSAGEPGQPLTGTGDVMGTAHYMAPEQIERSRDVDHRADIYSLGVVIYEMLTGSLPLGRFAPPSQASGGDVRLDEVVLKALERDPRKRWQQASEIKAAVEHASGAPAEPTAAPAAVTPETLEATGIVMLVGAAVMVATALFRIFTADGRPGAAGVMGAALALLPIAVVVGWAGAQALRGRIGRWFIAARVLALVAIMPASECSDALTFGLIVLAVYLFGASWPRRLVARMRELRAGVRARRGGLPPRADAAASETEPNDMHWWMLMGFAPLLIIPLMSNPTMLVQLAPWLTVMVVACLAFIPFRRYRAAAANGGVVQAPSALHALITGIFRVVSALVLAAALLALGVIAVAAFRPDLIPPELRDHLSITIRSSGVTVSAQGGDSATMDEQANALRDAATRYLVRRPPDGLITTWAQAAFADAAKGLATFSRELHGDDEQLPTRARVLDLLHDINRRLSAIVPAEGLDAASAADVAKIRSCLEAIGRAPEAIGTIHDDTLKALATHLRDGEALGALAEATKRYCFSSAQAERLIENFEGSHDVHDQAIRLLLPRLTDPERFFHAIPPAPTPEKAEPPTEAKPSA